MGLAFILLCALLVVQVVQVISVLDLGPSINPFSGNKQFIVRVVHSLPSFDLASERLATYRDAEGHDYSCILPEHSDEEQANDHALHKFESAKDLLKTIHGHCVRQKEGWWIFEVCVGQHVRQYHTTNNQLDEEYMMGVFNETEQDYTLQGQPGAPLHAVQVYTKGQVCDLTGVERRVDVRFLCSQDPIHITAIEEIFSCQYVIVVSTPAICSEALGTIQGDREKIRLREVFCAVEETSRDTLTVLHQEIASSVEKARRRGEPHIPEPPPQPATQQVAPVGDNEDSEKRDEL